MNKSRIRSNLYMERKIKYINHELTVVSDPNGYLYADGIYPTKILPEDLPEWYVYGYMYKLHGYISAKGVKHLLYVPNYIFDNHLHKYDSLFISYNEPIEPYEYDRGHHWYKGYDQVVSSSVLRDFVEAAGKYSGYDISEIQKEIARKTEFFYERNPDRVRERIENEPSEKFGRRLPYRGKDYILGGGANKKPLFDNCFCVPVKHTDEQIKNDCINIYKELAKRDLAEKVQEFAAKMGIKPPEIKINSAKTSLGSYTGALNFSWRLITGTDDIIDYVVVSVLAHTIEPNRTPKFWALVESVLPEYQEQQRRLKWLLEKLKDDDWL